MTVRNRIFPPWSEIKNLKVQLWPGEEFLAKFLDNNLPIDWNIYLKTEFEWAGSETPDIVIAHKSKGIMIFEVKDINIITNPIKFVCIKYCLQIISTFPG